MSEKETILAVPSNIITGFLGVGKTSAILHLLKHKPANERWAVLVNEFGEIGVDGGLFGGEQAQEQGVYIREVPGGCMCCAAGLPMQIALNQLLRRAKPDRLLIEPTGLGHPVEVLQILSGSHYQDILSIEKILTLVDARKFADSRYTKHETFQQQIALADIIIANKQDLYQAEDRSALEQYLNENGLHDTPRFFSEGGAFEPQLLQGPTAAKVLPHELHFHGSEPHRISSEDEAEDSIPECGYISAQNSGEGFESLGWRFGAGKVFCREKLFQFFTGLEVERMKAVLITESGIFGYNLTADALTEMELDDCLESRIEIIATSILPHWEKQLLACLSN